MPRNPAELYDHASEYNIDRRLAEWSQIQLALRRDNHSKIHHQGHLPYISPYSTNIYPKYTSQFDVQKHDTTGYSPDEEPQHAYKFNNHEDSQSYISSPIDGNNIEESPPPIELRLKQSTGDAMAQIEARLNAINGVMIPSRNTPNGGSPESSGNASNSVPSAHHICPICRAGYSQRYEIACHFVTCVDQHGNPDGACWDDYSSSTGQATSPQESEQTIRQTAPPQPINPIPTPRRGPHYQSERKTTFNDRLNAVNGVVIPPKLPLTKTLQTQPSKPRSSTPLQLSCPICKSLFGRRDHVRSHFAACVDRNGNPDGVRWDDGVPTFRRGPRGPMGPRGVRK